MISTAASSNIPVGTYLTNKAHEFLKQKQKVKISKNIKTKQKKNMLTNNYYNPYFYSIILLINLF